MKASELVQKELNDGDTIVLESDIENVINRCCGCGLLHHIKIQRSGEGIIRMTWEKIEGDPEIKSPREVSIEANKADAAICTLPDKKTTESSIGGK